MSARIRPVKYKAPTVEKTSQTSQNILSVTPAAVNSVYYATLIWLAFIITCLTLILPHFINQRHFWTVLELLSARRWFDVAYNALHARPIAVDDKIKEGDVAQPTSVKPVLFQRILSKLGLISNRAPYTMPVAAEESMLNFYGDTGYVQIPDRDVEDKEKFGMEKDDPSSNQHLWYLMERPDIQDQLIDNPFKQLTSLTFPDEYASPMQDPNGELSFAQQVEEIIKSVSEIQENLAVVAEEEAKEPTVAKEAKAEVHSPLVCHAGSCQYHASLDPTKLNDPKYFSAGVERLIKEMLQDVAVAAAQDTDEKEINIAKIMPAPAPEDVVVIPKLFSEKFAEPIIAPMSAAGDQSPLAEPILSSTEPLKINNQFSSTGISEPLPVSSFRLTPTNIMSEVLVRPSQQRLSHLPDVVVLSCDIDLTNPNGWRLAQWKPCEIRISAEDIVIRYRNRKDQLVEKRITEKDPTKFTFTVPRSLKTGISASARRFGLVCPKGHFRFRAPDHESQAKIMRAIQTFTRPVTV